MTTNVFFSVLTYFEIFINTLPKNGPFSGQSSQIHVVIKNQTVTYLYQNIRMDVQSNVCGPFLYLLYPDNFSRHGNQSPFS